VDQQQAPDHAVAREPEEQPFLSLLRQLADNPRQPLAVQLDDRRDELVDRPAQERIGRRVDCGMSFSTRSSSSCPSVGCSR